MEVIRQPGIIYDFPVLLSGDDVHLSRTGYNMYLTNLAVDIKLIEASYREGRGQERLASSSGSFKDAGEKLN